MDRFNNPDSYIGMGRFKMKIGLPELLVGAIVVFVAVSALPLSSFSVAGLGNQYGYIQYATINCQALKEVEQIYSTVAGTSRTYTVMTQDTVIQSFSPTTGSSPGPLIVNGNSYCTGTACIGKTLSRGWTVKVNPNAALFYSVDATYVALGKMPLLYYNSPQYASSTGLEIPGTTNCQSQLLLDSLKDKSTVVDLLGLSQILTNVQGPGSSTLTPLQSQILKQPIAAPTVGATVATIPEWVVGGVQPTASFNGEPASCNPVDQKVYGFSPIVLANGQTTYVLDRGKILVNGQGNPSFACSIDVCVSNFGSGATLDKNFICQKAATLPPSQGFVCQLDSQCSGQITYVTTSAGDTQVTPKCVSGSCTTVSTSVDCNPTRSYGTKTCVIGVNGPRLVDTTTSPSNCPVGQCCDTGNKASYLSQTCQTGYECINKLDGIGVCQAPSISGGTGCTQLDVLCRVNSAIGGFFQTLGVVALIVILVFIVFMWSKK